MNVEFSKITRICRPVSAMNWIYSFHSGFKHLNWYLLEIPNSYRAQYCLWYVNTKSIFMSSPCCFSIFLDRLLFPFELFPLSQAFTYQFWQICKSLNLFLKFFNICTKSSNRYRDKVFPLYPH